MRLCLLLSSIFVATSCHSLSRKSRPIRSVGISTEFSQTSDKALGIAFLEEFDRETSEKCHHRTLKEWILASDITPAHRADAANATLEYFKFWKQKVKQAQKYKWEDYDDPLIQRQFKFLSALGITALPEEKLKKYNLLRQKLESTFSTAKICKPLDLRKCDLALEPEVTELMMTSHNEAELKSLWMQWRQETGKKMKMDYVELASIMKEIALINKFPNASSYETRLYDSQYFLPDLEKLWNQLSPFYVELHAYVRRKLGNVYGVDIVRPTEPIPSHLLGNMWAQSWSNIFDLVTPYNFTRSIDATPFMVSQNFTPRKMAEVAEDFFISMGFPPLPQEFWKGSILEKRSDKEMVCHASSWDLCDKKNFWIKQCTRVNMEDLITLHHEMGHTIYQIQYKNQPKLFRDGSNPAFHESIGDLIALSVKTPEHLMKIGLLDGIEENPQADINYLLKMALEKIAFLPFGLLVDKWRWDVFDGRIPPSKYNCEWWKLRLEYQGVSPPETRSEEDFDPGAKYHVAANAGYIRYFVSTIIEFQFHQALCKVALEFDPSNSSGKPLHKCDIYGNKDAGQKLMNMLKLGSSKPWPAAMEILTGQREMNASAILDYFQPLIHWLRVDNRRNNATIGWKEVRPACRSKNNAGTFNPFFVLHVMTSFLLKLWWIKL